MMDDELGGIDLDKLSIEQVKRLKNKAIERLRAAGEMVFSEASHQNGGHTDHTDHSTSPPELPSD
jgi:hypothetical protein